MFKQKYSNQCHKPRVPPNTHLTNPTSLLQIAPRPNLSLTTIQVRNQLWRIKARKVVSPNGTSSRLLKSCAYMLCWIAEHLFNLSLKLMRGLQLLKTSCVVPVPKTNDIHLWRHCSNWSWFISAPCQFNYFIHLILLTRLVNIKGTDLKILTT